MVAQVKENYTEVAYTYNIKLSVPKLTNTGHYFIKQKLTGIAMAVIGIISPFIFDNNDATISLLLIPLGLYIIATRSKVIFD